MAHMVEYIEIFLSVIHIVLLLWLIHSMRNVLHGKDVKGFHIPKEGLMRATRNAVLGPKGAILRTPDAQEDQDEANRKKRLFLAKAEKNPLTPLPEGLNPEDFR